MTKTSQINYNGKLFPAESPVLTAQNRAFRYGDGLFETIRIIDGKIPLLALHFQRILRGLNHFKIDIPQNFSEAFLKKEILDLAKKTGTEKNGRARLNLFRADGGLYGPDDNKLNYLIETKTIDVEAFTLNETGLKVDIYPDMEKHFSPVSAYKTNNALLYVLASIHKKEHELDDCLVMNSRSRIIESIDSNLFIVKGNELYTPPLAEGCVAGVMREFILYIAGKEEITVHEHQMTLEELFEADEVFLSNAIYGIRWIEHYKSKIFTKNMAEKLSKLIRTELIEN